MAENDAGSALGGFIAIALVIAAAHSCSDSTVPSHDSTAGQVSQVDEALKKFETARKELSEVAYDEGKREQYVEAVDAELDRMDYDFDGVWLLEDKSRNWFRHTLIEACRARGIAPPTYLPQIGPPFDQRQATLDWSSSSDSSKLPDTVRLWIETQGATVDSQRQEVIRLEAKQVVASRIKDLNSLRTDLESKLGNARKLLRKFESDIDDMERNLRNERTETNLAMATLRSKRAYAKYLRTFIDGLKGATTELQYMETQSRDEFAMQDYAGADELRQLVKKIDRTLTKYRGSTFERKLDVDIDGRQAESQKVETR
jgi:hypothetical protein